MRRIQKCLLTVGMLCFASISVQADFIIRNDPGGDVGTHLLKYEKLRKSGQRVIIDEGCHSACTLVLGIVPLNRICVTKKAILGFHSASFENRASDGTVWSRVPSNTGTRILWENYPPAIQRWLAERGGTTPTMKFLEGAELRAIIRPCG